MTAIEAGVLVRGAEAERLRLPSNVTQLLAEGKDTNGAFSLIRTSLEPGGDGARPHHHARATELFFVIGGAVDLLVGEAVVTAGVGDVAVVLPGAMHAYANGSATARCDLLIVFGPGIERFDFFRLLGDIATGTKPASEVLATRERFDNCFGESAAWAAHRARGA